MLCAPPVREGMFGCGSLRDGAGEPLRPGGLALTRELIDRAGFRAGETVADIGCGLGASTRLLLDRGVAAIGVDLVVPSDAGARGEAPPLVVADAARLPFADDSLDGVLSECSLSLTADRERTLAEWFRKLRRGGRLALSDVYRRDRRRGGADRDARGAVRGRRRGWIPHRAVRGSFGSAEELGRAVHLSVWFARPAVGRRLRASTRARPARRGSATRC